MKIIALMVSLFISIVSMAQIVLPDTIVNSGCSGSIVYDFSINCDGDKDQRAVFTWYDCSGNIIQSGTYPQGSNQLSISVDSACFYLTVYTLNDTLISNIVYWYNQCLSLGLDEHYFNDKVSKIIDINGREVNQIIDGINIIIYESGRFVKIYK